MGSLESDAGRSREGTGSDCARPVSEGLPGHNLVEVINEISEIPQASDICLVNE